MRSQTFRGSSLGADELAVVERYRRAINYFAVDPPEIIERKWSH
jgi:hypothetical protein